ncbi:hypothetical protein M2282_005210 [Variovorax boronicumulans]|uniref:hypothetical protein n=1 Tax=Variovorax boronicumulans TaxID=436515 RepID=UPI002475BB5B|nr:hypothetical protein [Variovorax boronicumulans]MDH6170040.1 hypothetical protein [Variovorax boronicumulans]
MSTSVQDSLRRIAIHVEEAKTGGFEWVLSEADANAGDDRWTVLKRARKAVKSYKASMADGLVALQSLINNLDIGPRTAKPEGEPEAASPRKRPSRPAPAKHRDEKPPAKTSGRTVFGFGLMK